MNQIEPLLRELVNKYFDRNKQANMDSEAARNNLARHMAKTLLANKQEPNKYEL
jgi:hypothetical protein